MALFFLQGGQYLVSLITLPILTHRLGVEGFGKMGFSLAMTAYLGLLVEWGYGVSATREIAVYRGDVRAMSLVFWSTFFGKLILLVAAAAMLELMTIVGPEFLNNSGLLWISFGMVVANCITPNFLFQGVEKLEVLFSVNLMFRFLTIPLILLLVHDAEDVTTAQGIISLGVITAAFFNLYLLYRFKLVAWIPPSLHMVYASMVKAAPLFVSMAAIGLFANSLTVMLGYVSGVVAVGAFTAALNLYKAAQGLFAPLYQVFFPRFSHLFHHDLTKGVLMFKQVLYWQTPVTVLVALCLAYAAQWGVPFLLGDQFIASIQIFQGMCLVLVLNGIATLLGSHLLIALNHQEFFTRSVILAGSASILAAFILNLFMNGIGSVAAMCIFELIVIGMSIFGLLKMNPSIVRALVRD